jgi:hypothetical protein
MRAPAVPHRAEAGADEAAAPIAIAHGSCDLTARRPRHDVEHGKLNATSRFRPRESDRLADIHGVAPTATSTSSASTTPATAVRPERRARSAALIAVGDSIGRRFSLVRDRQRILDRDMEDLGRSLRVVISVLAEFVLDDADRLGQDVVAEFWVRQAVAVLVAGTDRAERRRDQESLGRREKIVRAAV